MGNKYICMKCKRTGDKASMPYKIIKDINGEGVKFIGQLCESCFETLTAPAPSTDENNEKES